MHTCACPKPWTAQDKGSSRPNLSTTRGSSFSIWEHTAQVCWAATARPCNSIVTKQARLVCQCKDRSRVHIKGAQTLEIITSRPDKIHQVRVKQEQAQFIQFLSKNRTNTHNHLSHQKSWWPRRSSKIWRWRAVNKPKSASTKHFFLGAGTRYT